MNKRTIYILTLITFILALVVLYPLLKSSIGISVKRGNDIEINLSNLSTEGINKIIIKKGEDEKVLSKSDSGWQINNLPVTDKSAEDFIKKLEQIKIDRLVSKNRENHARFGIDEKEGYSLSLYKDDTLKILLLIGKQAAGFNTFYVRKKDSDNVYSAFGEIYGYLSRSLDDWKDKGKNEGNRQGEGDKKGNKL